jgi:hypothetical protein
VTEYADRRAVLKRDAQYCCGVLLKDFLIASGFAAVQEQIANRAVIMDADRHVVSLVFVPERGRGRKASIGQAAAVCHRVTQ